MAKMQAAAQGGPVVDEAAMEEMRRLIFEAPIAELAESQGISIDEAVQLRVEKNLEAAEVPIEVTVRPIEKQGKTMGFASVNIGGMVVDDFRVIDGKNGVFLGAPSKPDPTSRTGYRSTARVMDRHLQERLDAAAAQGYTQAVEKLIARAEALRPAPIKEQMAKAAKEAGKENAARPAPAGAQGNRRHRPLHAPARSPGPGADRLHSRFPQAFGHPLPHGIQRHAFFPLRVSGQSSSMGRSTARQWDNTVPR